MKDLNVQWQDAWANYFNFVWDNGGQHPNKRSKDAAEKRLGKWAGRQKYRAQKGTLSADRRSKLEEIEGWEWSKQVVAATVPEAYTPFAPFQP